MPFKRNDPRTIELAKQAGRTGKKHFQTLPKEEHRKISVKAGKHSGRVRREKARQKIEVKDRSHKSRVSVHHENPAMRNYLET